MSKTFIAYFSHTGENYFGGSIRNIDKGNTEIVAEIAQKITGGDLFEIKTVKPYPKEYQPAIEYAKKEKENNERPEIVALCRI